MGFGPHPRVLYENSIWLTKPPFAVARLWQLPQSGICHCPPRFGGTQPWSTSIRAQLQTFESNKKSGTGPQNQRRVEWSGREGVSATTIITTCKWHGRSDGHCWNSFGNSGCLVFTNSKETVARFTWCIQCTQARQTTLLSNATTQCQS